MEEDDEKAKSAIPRTQNRPLVFTNLSRHVIISIAIGDQHACYLTDTGKIFAHGNNFFGQVGCPVSEETANIREPRPVEFEDKSEHFIEIACGGNHSLALTRYGQVYSWGRSLECGRAVRDGFTTGLFDGDEFAAALSGDELEDNDDVFEDDALAFLNDINSTATGVELPGKVHFFCPNCPRIPGQKRGDSSRIQTIAARDGRSVAVSEYGKVFEWGLSPWSVSSSPNHTVSVPSAKLKELDADAEYFPELVEAAKVLGHPRQALHPCRANSHWPDAELSLVDRYAGLRRCSVKAGSHFNVLVDTEGQCWGWGEGSFGQLGASAMIGQGELSTPAAVQSFTCTGDASVGSLTCVRRLDGVLEPPAVEVAAGARHVMVLNTEGTLLAMGDGQFGQTGGMASVTDRLTPVRVLTTIGQNKQGDRVVKKMACGENHSACVTSDGLLFTWGHADWGKLVAKTEADVTGPGVYGDMSSANVNSAPVRHGVAVGSSFRNAVHQPRLVHSFVADNVGVIGLGEECTIVVTGDAYGAVPFETTRGL